MNRSICHPRTIAGAVRLATLLCVALTLPALAQTAGGAARPERTLSLGASLLLDFQGVERLAVSDPAIIDYVVLSAKQVMLIAKKVGEADLYAWDKQGQHAYHVLVAPTTSPLPGIVTRIKQAINDPAIIITEHKETVLLEGEVVTQDEVKRADIIARAYAPKVENLIRVVGKTGSDWRAEPTIEKNLATGGSELLEFLDIERSTVSDPAVIDAVTLSGIQLIVVGKKAGEAYLYVWDKKGPHIYRVRVQPPADGAPDLAARVTQAIARPAIKVSGQNEMLLLEGDAESADEAQRAEAIARAFSPNVVNLIRAHANTGKPVLDLEETRRVLGGNIRLGVLADGLLVVEGQATSEQRARLNQIIQSLGSRATIIDMVTVSDAPPRQILVRVRAVEVNRNALGELGIDWGGLNADGVHDQPIIFGETSTGPFEVGEGGQFRRLEAISARLKALVTSHKARILAEPNLMVAEGEQAQILVGGEIPIPVAQNRDTITIEWKDYGVKLAIKGFVKPDGKNIDLEVAPEVSNLDYANEIVINDLRIPALQTRRAHSLLHMRDGQTLVIGGLYQTERTKTERKVPLLGDLPLVGSLFRRTDRQAKETDLMIFVTPEIVTESSSTARTEESLRKMGDGH